MGEWKSYILEDFKIDFPLGSFILDVGCGEGHQMRELSDRGYQSIGVDIDGQDLIKCRQNDLSVVKSFAERLPFADDSFDGIVCRVVLPYTDERAVVREFGRLLKPSGKCYLISHGAGYYVRYVMQGDSIIKRFYGLRSLLNTWLLFMTRRRIPGFLGDTIYQSQKRLSQYFADSGLTLVKESPSPRFHSFPVFIYQVVSKSL